MTSGNHQGDQAPEDRVRDQSQPLRPSLKLEAANVHIDFIACPTLFYMLYIFISIFSFLQEHHKTIAISLHFVDGKTEALHSPV